MMFGTLMQIELSQALGTDLSDSVSSKNANARVIFFIGRWPTDQNKSHIETGNNLYRSMIAQKKAKQRRETENPNHKLHVR